MIVIFFHVFQWEYLNILNCSIAVISGNVSTLGGAFQLILFTKGGATEAVWGSTDFNHHNFAFLTKAEQKQTPHRDTDLADESSSTVTTWHTDKNQQTSLREEEGGGGGRGRVITQAPGVTSERKRDKQSSRPQVWAIDRLVRDGRDTTSLHLEPVQPYLCPPKGLPPPHTHFGNHWLHNCVLY